MTTINTGQTVSANRLDGLTTKKANTKDKASEPVVFEKNSSNIGKITDLVKEVTSTEEIREAMIEKGKEVADKQENDLSEDLDQLARILAKEL